MNTNNNIYQDLGYVWGVTAIVVATLLSFLFFSPYSMQYEEKQQVIYSSELMMVDNLIAQNTQGQNHIAFRGRTSKKGIRYGAAKTSPAKYDLPCKRAEQKVALAIVDSLITEKQRGLSSYAYFDRYMSEEDRNAAELRRTEIYELQWKRIQLLEHADSVKALRSALRPYVKIVGYHQDEAKTLYQQLTH